MPATPTRKNGPDAVITSRAQSILGPARAVVEPPALPIVTTFRGVPIPQAVREPHPVWSAIIDKLNAVGDFVLVENSKEFPTIADDATTARSLHDRANRAGKSIVVRRKVEVGGKVGLGVWFHSFRPKRVKKKK